MAAAFGRHRKFLRTDNCLSNSQLTSVQYPRNLLGLTRTFSRPLEICVRSTMDSESSVDNFGLFMD